MILLHLLVSLLSLGAVELQTANMTHEVLRNETFTEGNYTLGSTNETFNWREDEWHQLEDKFEGRTGNETSDAMAEDDEGFQEQETKFSGSGTCQYGDLEESIHLHCGQPFHLAMMSFHPEDRCVLGDIIGPYNAMSKCLEEVSQYFNCFYPNPHIQNFYISVHSEYFHRCTNEEDEHVLDEKILIALVLVPVSLIPILVFMVVRKSKVQE